MTTEICVPLESLSAGDDQSTTPAMGDPVEFSAAGTVTKIEGGNAYVTVDTVNGAPVVADDVESPAGDGMDALQSMAGKADDDSDDSY